MHRIATIMLAHTHAAAGVDTDLIQMGLLVMVSTSDPPIHI